MMKLLAQTGIQSIDAQVIEKQAERNTKGLQSDSITDTTTGHPKFHYTTLMNSTAMLVFKSCLGKLVGTMHVRESLVSFVC